MEKVESLRTVTLREISEATAGGASIEDYPGHAYTDLARYAENTRHMIVFEMQELPVPTHPKRMRLYLTDTAYDKALKNQEAGSIKILHHARVVKGELFYDGPGQSR